MQTYLPFSLSLNFHSHPISWMQQMMSMIEIQASKQIQMWGMRLKASSFWDVDIEREPLAQVLWTKGDWVEVGITDWLVWCSWSLCPTCAFLLCRNLIYLSLSLHFPFQSLLHLTMTRHHQHRVCNFFLGCALLNSLEKRLFTYLFFTNLFPSLFKQT